MFSFLPSLNNSVTIGPSFLLLSISAIELLKMINVSYFLFGFHSSIFLFLQYLLYHLSIQYKF